MLLLVESPLSKKHMFYYFTNTVRVTVRVMQSNIESYNQTWTSQVFESHCIKVALPIALATSDTSAPVLSQISDMALMLEIFWAKKALAASLDNSDDQVFIVMIRSARVE